MIRPIEEKDYEAFMRLYEEAYFEYLEWLRYENPSRHLAEQKRRTWGRLSRERFDYYLGTESTFVAEDDDGILGYIASQTVNFLHGVNKLLWIEYIVVTPKCEGRRRVCLVLLNRIVEYAKQSGMDRIYTAINLDNEALMRLHAKVGFDLQDWKIASHKVENV